MIDTLDFTLLPEGTSDRALLPILTWILGEHVSKSTSVRPAFVDAGRLPRGATKTPCDRLRSAVDVYPCHILFIHRDADNSSWDDRKSEIERWNEEAAPLNDDVTVVPVIPIRTTEAWLLIDEVAIRRAAGNPNGTVELNLPKTHELEGVADPKQLLFDALAIASELTERRRKKFDRNNARVSIGSLMSEMPRLSIVDRIPET